MDRGAGAPLKKRRRGRRPRRPVPVCGSGDTTGGYGIRPRLSKKVCSPLGPLCEGAPPAGGGGENCTVARNISGYGKVLSLRPFGAPPSQRGVFRQSEIIKIVDRGAGAPLKKDVGVGVPDDPCPFAAAVTSAGGFCFCPWGQKLHHLYYFLFILYYLKKHPRFRNASAFHLPAFTQYSYPPASRSH